MRVLLAQMSLTPGHGGPAFSVSSLAKALTEAGAEVGVWAADQSASSTPLLPLNSPIERLTGDPAAALAKFGKIDIIHDNGIWLPHNHRLARLAAHGGIPRIISIRGMLEPWAMQHKQWKKKLAWWLYQKSDLMKSTRHHVTAGAEEKNVKQLNLGVPIRMIPNGVDIPPIERDLGIEQKTAGHTARRVALFLGRLYPVKGLPMLVEAWARVRPLGWSLRIAGPDEAGHRAVVERAVAAAGLDGDVSFVGQLDKTGKRLALLQADFLVLPSHSESFGMVVAEALAHGIPVLTTTGVPWPTLGERGCGWWVDATVEGLAAGLRHVTSQDHETLQAMGDRGREFMIAEFGWQRLAQDYLQMYEEVLA